MMSKNKSLEIVHGHLQPRNACGADSKLQKEAAAGSKRGGGDKKMPVLDSRGAL